MVQFDIFGTYINEECAIEVIRLKMLPHQREGQRVESLPKLRRDDGGMVGETGEDGSLMQTYPPPPMMSIRLPSMLMFIGKKLSIAFGII